VLRAGALPRALAATPAPSAEELARAVMTELVQSPSALPGSLPLQMLDVRPVRFECPCSRERAQGSLALLGGAELASMIVEDGKAEVVCEFCRERYEFSEGELEVIRRETAPRAGLPS
jgi:redox-regulated HSP33 family molecular chaperone